MPLDVVCPNGHKLEISRRFAGKRIKCPECSSPVAVPDLVVAPTKEETLELETIGKPLSPALKKTTRKDSKANDDRKKVSESGQSSLLPTMLVLGSGAVLLLVVGIFAGMMFSRGGRSESPASQASSELPQTPQGADSDVTPRAPEPDQPTVPSNSASPENAESKRSKPIGSLAMVQAPPSETPNKKPSTTEKSPAGKSSRPKEIVRLNSPIDRIAIGGSGRYLIASLLAAKQVAVIDVEAKQIVKTIAVDDKNVLLAAGETKFFVLQPGAGTLARFDLDSLERELTVSAEPFHGLAMGSSSEGPLLAVRSNLMAVDVKTLKPTALSVGVPHGIDGLNLMAAAGGNLFTNWRSHLSPSGIISIEVLSDSLQSSYQHDSDGALLPSADGQVIYGHSKKYNSKGKHLSSVNGPHRMTTIPAATGPFYMQFVTPQVSQGRPNNSPNTGELKFRSQRDDTDILTITDAVLPDLRQDVIPEAGRPLNFHQRLHWLPLVNSLVTIPATCDQLIIQQFNLKEELDKSGQDYLFMTSTPPTIVERGGKLTYSVEVLSKQEKPTFSLESFPKGMNVSQAGLLEWNVPKDFGVDEAIVIVGLKNQNGREITQTFKLAIVAAGECSLVQQPKVDVGSTKAKRPVPTVSKKSATAVKQAETIPNPRQTVIDPRPREVVKLPAEMQRPVIGGSGKYLLSFVPKSKQVVIVDVAARQVAKSIPVDDPEPLIAAGETQFVVLQRRSGVISSFKLGTWERLQTASCDPYETIAMGSSSEGPILARGSQLKFLDLQTLKVSDIEAPNLPRNQITAAANGRVFGCCNPDSSDSYSVFELQGDTITIANNLGSPRLSYSGGFTLSPDGRMLYCGLGRMSRNFQLLDRQSENYTPKVVIPAASGHYFLSMSIAKNLGQQTNAQNHLTLHNQQDGSLLLAVKDATLPETDPNVHPAHVSQLGLDRRIFLLPIADSLVTVPKSLDRFIIHRFKIKEELDASEIDYFFVKSTPPHELIRGQKMEYAIKVESKKQGLKFHLESAPPGMTVSPAGLVTWNVPHDFPDPQSIAIVNIKNSSDQELAHTIKLLDPSVKLPDTPAPKTTPAPRVKQIQRPSQSQTPSPAPSQTQQPQQPVQQSAQHATPEKTGDNRWHWNGTAPMIVRTEKGAIGGILTGRLFHAIKPDGTPQLRGITLPSEYRYLATRSKEMIGVAVNPTRVEVISLEGRLLKTIPLTDESRNAQPTGFVVHPNKPFSYLALDRTVGPFRGAFAVIDEQSAKVIQEKEQLGQNLGIDPGGRFLVSTFVHSVHIGDQVVVTQQRPGSIPQPQVPLPGRGGIRRGHIPQPLPSQPRVGVQRTYANVALALVYDLNLEDRPEIHTVAPLEMTPGIPRLSFDGRRMTTIDPNSKLTKYFARNPLDLKAEFINFEVPDSVGKTEHPTDFSYHPMLPIAILSGPESIRFFDTEKGKPIADIKTIVLTDLPQASHLSAIVSADGMHVVAIASKGNSEQVLVRVKLSLTKDERTQISKKASQPPTDLKESAPPRKQLTALGTGISKSMTVAEISELFADSVVIVRNSKSTGTGFIVGSSGLILTCAHCVSPLEPVEIVYHPPGKPNETEVIEARIVSRDRKADLALLEIDVEKPLHSVILAPPADAKNGEAVTVISNPGLAGAVLDNTVTTGIISTAKRIILGNDYIQSSAAVNPGSSGGPMFDQNGRVIGVVVLKAGIEGVGFAVPSTSFTKFLLKSTRADGDDGQFVRDWEISDKPFGEARFLGIKNGTVTLAKTPGGKPETFPLSDFSSADQKLLELLDQEK